MSADSANVALVPEAAPPIGANRLVVPSTSVARFDLQTGSRRHWLRGLIAGIALGLVAGFAADVDCGTAGYYGSLDPVELGLRVGF